jgi:uncharacterized membrane protein
MEWKNRLRNYGFWTSVASLVLLALQTAGVEVVPEQYEAIVQGVLALLVALGLVNNPATVNKGFMDDK